MSEIKCILKAHTRPFVRTQVASLTFIGLDDTTTAGRITPANSISPPVILPADNFLSEFFFRGAIK